jgi:hypothetical protein
MKRTLALSVVCAVVAAIAAPMAFAQVTTLEAYKEGTGPDTASAIDVLPTADRSNDPGSDPSSDGDPSSNSEVATAEADSLPFTGLDVGIVLVLGLALVGTGFAVRRVARST